MQELADLEILTPLQRPQFADTVFDTLHRKILSLELPPGMRLSEVNVATAMGVSRQPVRDAFYRLSKLGFLTIRPQVATQVAPISEKAVLQARFVREAIEVACVRAAAETLTAPGFDKLEATLAEQDQAVAAADSLAFHELDDRFHHELCVLSGHGFAWEVLREHKAHMDRVRFLSLSFSREEACRGHWEIFEALKRRDADTAAREMTEHLSRIKGVIGRIRAEHEDYFDDDGAAGAA